MLAIAKLILCSVRSQCSCWRIPWWVFFYLFNRYNMSCTCMYIKALAA